MIIRIGAGLRRHHARLLLQGPCQRLSELLTIVGAEDFVRWLPEPPQHEKPEGMGRHEAVHAAYPCRGS